MRMSTHFSMLLLFWNAVLQKKVCDDRLSSMRIRKNFLKKEDVNTLFNAVVLVPNFAEKICDDRLSSKRRRKNFIKKDNVNTLSMLLLFWYSQFCRKNNSGWQIELKEKKKKTTSSRAP
jgi:hypothetical protein